MIAVAASRAATTVSAPIAGTVKGAEEAVGARRGAATPLRGQVAPAVDRAPGPQARGSGRLCRRLGAYVRVGPAWLPPLLMQATAHARPRCRRCAPMVRCACAPGGARWQASQSHAGQPRVAPVTSVCVRDGNYCPAAAQVNWLRR